MTRPSNTDQAIWLARGVALGILVGRLLHALRAGVDRLRNIGLARGMLAKRP